jgi:hypothetical protein
LGSSAADGAFTIKVDYYTFTAVSVLTFTTTINTLLNRQ